MIIKKDGPISTGFEFFYYEVAFKSYEVVSAVEICHVCISGTYMRLFYGIFTEEVLVMGGFQLLAMCYENDISPITPLVCLILITGFLFWACWLYYTGGSFSYCYRELKELLKKKNRF